MTSSSDSDPFHRPKELIRSYGPFFFTDDWTDRKAQKISEKQAEKRKVDQELENPPVAKKSHLTEEETSMIALGRAIVALDPSKFPRDIEIRKDHVKFSGENIMTNMYRSLEFLKKSIGDPVKKTMFNNVAAVGAAFSGFSERTVQRYSPHVERLPPRKRIKDMNKTERSRNAASQLSHLNRMKLVSHIHEMWLRDEAVTLQNLCDWARYNMNYTKSKTQMGYILKGLGFVWKLKNHNTILDERFDIIVRRRKFLKLMEKLEKKGYHFGCYDETWVHEGMCDRRGWQHKNDDMYKRARWMDLSQPMSGPRKGKERGRRAIVLAVLTPNGIVHGTGKVIVSGAREEEQLSDYHQEMNGKYFEKYMNKAVPLLKKEADSFGKPAALLIDNAPYHNRTLKKPPTCNSNKPEIMEWLTANGVKFNLPTTKKNLVSIMNSFMKQCGGRDAFTEYAFDEWAKSQGVQIVRLPQYHCMFNSIELFWSQLKTYLRGQGKFEDKIALVVKRTEEFMSNFPAPAARSLFEKTSRLIESIRVLADEEENQVEDVDFNLQYDQDDDGVLRNIEIIESDEELEEDEDFDWDEMIENETDIDSEFSDDEENISEP